MARKTTYHVYSKLSAPVSYHEHVPGGANVTSIGRTVTIAGGAGVANKNLITPLGVHTEVTEEEMEFLNNDETFKLHKQNGFIAIETKNYDIEKVVADMTSEPDPGGPLTPGDFENVPEGTAKPVGV